MSYDERIDYRPPEVAPSSSKMTDMNASSVRALELNPFFLLRISRDELNAELVWGDLPLTLPPLAIEDTAACPFWLIKITNKVVRMKYQFLHASCSPTGRRGESTCLTKHGFFIDVSFYFCIVNLKSGGQKRIGYLYELACDRLNHMENIICFRARY